MKRLCILILCVWFVCISLCGCSDESEERNYTNNTTPSTNRENVGSDISKQTFDFDYNCDFGGFWWFAGYDNMVYSCSGVGEGDEYIMYVADLEKEVQVPLCNNPNCKHNSYRCNAYICGGSDSVDGIKLQGNNIYVVIKSFIGDIFSWELVRISLDGTTREDLGSIVQYKVDNIAISGSVGDSVQIVDDYVYIMLRMQVMEEENRLDENGKIIEGIQNIVVDDKLKIYRYKIDGTEDSEVVLEENINNETGYFSQYNIYDEYLYYCSDQINKRINLNTMGMEVITDAMYYVSRYNNEGNILACTRTVDGIECYAYDKQSKGKCYLADSGLDKEYVEILTKSSFGIIKYYIDDKYIYIYEPNKADGTFIFDHQLKFIDFVEMAVYATVGDNLICTNKGDLVSIKRDTIFESDMDICTLVEQVSDFKFSWPMYIGN